MKREKLETYIGRQVKVLLFDGRAYEGCLQKTNIKTQSSITEPILEA